MDTTQSEQENEKVIEVSPNQRYAKLNRLLGKGAYKVVYKAIDREEGYEVAWNVCQTTKQEFMELSQEIEILKRVRHPNIIQFYDCWYNNTEFVFVTELMTSGTLREYIKKLAIPNLKIIKRWARQILKGLSHLHSHNPPIIHRDIKCDNIFINGAHGEVKIGDMGTAKMKLGKKYTVIGTPEFMAPEMYEEKGYTEKVDSYAFGMALLEMVTGEYPYAECKNAAQIYKKGIKPECLDLVTDAEIRDLIRNCIGPESERLTCADIAKHAFLAVEPEVVLLTMNDSKTHLTMQVVFKGLDKPSVKFEYHIGSDTAEAVVNEMIHENVLPVSYQHLITIEINRILREMNRPQISNDKNREEDKHVWKSKPTEPEEQLNPTPLALSINPIEPSTSSDEILPSTTSSSFIQASSIGINRKNSIIDYPDLYDIPFIEYGDDTSVDILVNDTVKATKRNIEKNAEWLTKLHAQDIMTVGDLRELHDEDWASLGLTVFASRALRNALFGKVSRSNSVYTRVSTDDLDQSKNTR